MRRVRDRAFSGQDRRQIYLLSSLRAGGTQSDSAPRVWRGFLSVPLALGLLNTRTVMAHALSIVDDGMHKELEAVRKIRNKFAHATTLVSFESEKLRPW
jgi:hypothetical protein